MKACEIKVTIDQYGMRIDEKEQARNKTMASSYGIHSYSHFTNHSGRTNHPELACDPAKMRELESKMREK